ncbi:MAG: hypothetical protein FWD26_01650 [Treponema sp.]|nr:hypothetical protein [Treponema sp.]
MKKNEMLLYQVNSLPSAIALLFLIFNTTQTIFTLNTIDVSAAGIRVMEIILVNIVLSFLVFIASSEIKRYNLRWSQITLALGIFQCLRFFLLPAGLHSVLIIVLPLQAAGFSLIIASAISLVRCKRYRKEKLCHT